MLVICNGAQKGGSTWVYILVQELLPLVPVPEAYRNPAFNSASLALDRVGAFLEETDWRERDYVCKQHWVRRLVGRDLANRPQVRMLNVIRDIRDVLVSRYYHDIRRGNVEQTDFASYYAGRGREMMEHYCGYQFYWHRDPGPGDVEPLLLSYEGLKRDFHTEASRLGAFLGRDPATLPLAKAEAATRIERLRGTKPIFRRGEIGDWREHFTPELAAAFEAQLADNGYLRFLETLEARGIRMPAGLTARGWAETLT